MDQIFTAALANSGSKEYQDLKNAIEKAVRRLKPSYLLRLPVGRGGVVNSPRFCFFFICQCGKLGYRSWVIPLAFLCCLAHCYISVKTILYGGICQQNTHFNMYTEISKRKQGSPCKNSHQRCFETTNFDRLHREELLFLPRYTHRLNSFSSTITQQNTHFNMYIETSNSNKVFRAKILTRNVLKRTNFDRYHREYINQYISM